MCPVAVSDDMSDSESGDAETESEDRVGVVLDFLPHGKTEDDRPQYEKSPLAYVVAEDVFTLREVRYGDETDVSIGDRITLDRSADVDIEAIIEVDHEELPSGARSELEYVVEEIVSRNEQRFVDFYNDAQPITLRLHQLNLLPGIGKKLRNNLLDERDRRPFQSFSDLEARVSGLHNPKEVLVERILEEIQEDDLKYQIFVQPTAQD